MALSGGILDITYVDSSTFKINGEKDGNDFSYTGIFYPGRKVRFDLDADGIVFSEVASSSYDSNNDETTVNINDSVLTSNLYRVWYSISTPGPESNIPLHTHENKEQGGLDTVHEHDNAKHNVAYTTKNIVGSMIVSMIPPSSAISEGNIYSITTVGMFEEGSTESFTTTT